MLVLISGCGDAGRLPTAPSAPVQAIESDAQLLGGLIDGVTSLLVAPLNRTTPLAAPVSWSFVAGPNGISSSNSKTGLTISIPRGALSSNVTITVTALAGSAVAYSFQPHGLQFAKSVTLTQSMRGINTGLLNWLAPVGGHFPGEEPVIYNGLALVNETSTATLSLLTGSMSFPIKHFSGWIMASGRGSSSDSGEY